MSDMKVNGVTYRQQYRKCGKAGCKCNFSEGHGPYWYSYDGSSAAKYVGIKLPEHVLKHMQRLKASRDKLKAIKAKVKKRRDDHYYAYRKAGDELRTLEALEAGERVNPAVLIMLGLAQFNGHDKRE
jgi:hypothetical protein